MICERRLEKESIEPDGLTGALLALEGIEDAAVLLHGPTGCRGHHSAMSERAFPRDIAEERLNYAERFYFGQPRIPTTYLDGDDFVFGAGEKLAEAVRTVLSRKPGILAVVNSPSAALIGEDIRQSLLEARAHVPCVSIEMPSISRPMAHGYQQAILAVLESLDLPRRAVRPGTVSLIGLSLAHRHWEGSLAELRRLLALCGIEVLCAPGAGSPTDEWFSLPSAACHIVVHDEYADRIVPWLTNRLGGAAVFPQMGAPIGFEATEQWLTSVAHAVGADPSAALEDVRERRRRVSRHLGRISCIGSALKGMTCSIHADASIALPLSVFLYDYLGILPVSVAAPGCSNSCQGGKLKEFLSKIGCPEAWQADWETSGADFLFSDGHRVNQRLSAGYREGGVELILPLGREVDFTQKSLLGAEGAACLVERIVNSVSDYL